MLFLSYPYPLNYFMPPFPSSFWDGFKGKGGGVYLGPKNRKTAIWEKTEKPQEKSGKTEKPKVQSILLLQLILGEKMVEKNQQNRKTDENKASNRKTAQVFS